MRAVLTFDDVDGQVNMTVFLEGGYQADSGAHMMANSIIKHLDEQAAVRSASDVKWVAGQDAAWIADEIVAIPSKDDTASRLEALERVRPVLALVK